MIYIIIVIVVWNIILTAYILRKEFLQNNIKYPFIKIDFYGLWVGMKNRYSSESMLIIKIPGKNKNNIKKRYEAII